MKKVRLEDIFFIKENTLAGIDELVYNPVTKNPADDYDKGADGGVIQNSISWGGHDNHLHIGATNRDVMMQIIDKADSLGLVTTENPYAKRDPNGKVDRVHTTNSFHYKMFPGEPKVGAGVDISGNQDNIRQLIRWVNANFRGKMVQTDPTSEAPEPEQTAQSSTDKPTSDTQQSSTTPATSSISSTPTTDSSTGISLSFLTPVISSLENLGSQMKQKYQQMRQTNENVENSDKLITEIKRIKNIMKS